MERKRERQEKKMDSQTTSLNNQGNASPKWPQEEPGGNVKKKRRLNRKIDKGKQETERGLQEKDKCLYSTTAPEASGCSGVSLESVMLEDVPGKAETPGHMGLASEEPTSQDVGSSVLPLSQPGQTTPTPGQPGPLLSQTPPPPGQTMSIPGQIGLSPGQTAALPGQTPSPGQATPIPGQTPPSPGQTSPTPRQTTPPLGQTPPPSGQITPPPGPIAPSPCINEPPLLQTPSPLVQSSLATTSANKGRALHVSSAAVLCERLLSHRIPSARQELTNQSVESLSTSPSPNPGTEGEETEETVRPNTNHPTTKGHGGESTPEPSRAESAKGSGNGAGDQRRKRRKDKVNSQRGLESGQAAPRERVLRDQEEQKSNSNPRARDAKIQCCEKALPTSSACAGSPVDLPAAENQDTGVDQNDDEGFQTVCSKRRKKKPEHPPKIPQNQPQAPSADGLTVYFHAILSKDFGLDPNSDQVYMTPGPPLGNWKWVNATKMEVTKDLGQHGYLVQGQLVTSRVIVSVPAPYKYVVWKASASGYECHFEYIYKRGATGIVNRCLLVKDLLTLQGELHQYDGIICAEPERGMITRFMSLIGIKEGSDITRGRHLAGKVMLEIIFDLLRSWSAVNVTNFLVQLRQFFAVYCNAHVFEENRLTAWGSLEYSQVKGLLKEFLLENIIPQKEEGRKETFLQDPLKAGLITMLVWYEHLELDNTEQLSYMCDLLCLPQKPREEFHVYWSDLASGFQDPQCVLMVVKMLEVFCTLALQEKLVKWILVLPLIHLLRGDCRPFEPLPPSLLPASLGFKAWAGLREISPSNFQPASQYTRALMEVMTTHTHLVEVDRLLSRSWLYLLEVEAVEDFCSSVPVDLHDVLQWLFFRLQAKCYLSKYQGVQQLLVYLSKSVKEQKFKCYDDSYRGNCLTVSLKLLERICQSAKEQRFHELPAACVVLVSAVAEFTACVPTKQSGENEAQLNSSTGEELRETLRMIRGWMGKTFANKLLRTVTLSVTFVSRYEIHAWNNILSLTFGGKEFTEFWRTTLLNDFEGKLKKERGMDQIEIYCDQIEEVNKNFPTLSACLEKCALEAVTSVCQGREEHYLFERLKRHDFRKFGKLVSALVLKAWPSDASGGYMEGEEEVLEHLLTWSAAKNVFQLQGTDGKLMDQLTGIARERMAVATAAFSTVSNKFLSGSIKMRILNQILKNKDTYLELLKIDGLSVSERCRKSAAMKMLIKFREEEVKSVYHEGALLRNLLEVCQKLQEHISVDVEDLESKLRVKVEEKTLDEFMEVHQPDKMPSENVGVVTYFDLPQGMREMAEALHTFRDSFIFNTCWKRQTKTLSHNDDTMGELVAASVMKASLEMIHTLVFQPCFRRYREIYDSLKSGALTLQDVDDIFEDYKGKYDELTNDLQIMSRIEPSDNNRWIYRCVQQIEQYHELHLALESAKVILEVKQILCPQGDFHIMDTLLGVTEANFKRETLDRIDSDLIRVKKEAAMTEEQRLCLQELCLRRNFIMWVKEALQDLTELKVFVDLASISAGENDLDVDRVACFHDAILGYSSVLYELKPDAGFKAFKKALEKLWKGLKNDMNLPKKLRDTARHLEWLKTVKDSHGSVELSSLSLASKINKKGLYTVCAQNQKKLTLDNTLKLEIMEEYREEMQQQQEVQRVRSYSLEDLRELLNKLMLMSGRGEQGQRVEVDRFSEVFSSVQRMAQAFIELHAAGNPLFQHWESKISCQPDSKTSIIMDFHLGSGVGKVTVEGDVLEQLPELCRKMEQYLSIWKDFMNEQRSTHYYLNYYTADQVVYLCDQLSSGMQTPVLAGQVVTMLSFIRPGCEVRGLREVLYAFWDNLHGKGMLLRQGDEVDSQTFSEEVLWEDEKEEEKGEEGPCNMEVTLETAFSKGGAVLLTTTLQGPLCQTNSLEQLDLLWDAYMKNMRAFLPHTLDIPNLGKLLDQLANKEEDEEEESREGEVKLVRRSLPGGFSSNRPNLVVCPPAEILISCLCVYMASELEPLPSYDEVLLCNPNTPYQQVELFLRRCLTAGYKGQKIYTLLHADQLAYDVSFRAEQLFQALSLRCTHDYRLVIICSSSREHAYLPSAFSQYRLLTVPQEPLERVRRYLSNHYTVPLEQPSAADVFKSRQFVGVVSSKRAGVGKSLYIQRLYEKLHESANKEVTLLKCIRLIEPRVDEDAILRSLLNTPEGKDLTIFHFDVMSSVQKGLHEFLFRLLILRYLMDSEGRMWQCSREQLYLIEILRSVQDLHQSIQRVGTHEHFSFLDVFPTVTCHPPKEVLQLEIRSREGAMMEDPLMDDQEFQSEAYQRPYQYLTRFHNGQNLDNFVYRGVEGTHMECLQILFIYCGVVDPSWAELRNFSWFLNVQLRDCETSIFCNADFVGDILHGFRNFVVDFMILMAKDFATPSLSISDQSPGRQEMDPSRINEKDLAPFRIRKRWESEPHPYIFFNGDHMSMTFIGFHLRKNGQNSVDAIHPTTGAVIRQNIMTKQLYEGLQLQQVPFNVDFDRLSRTEKMNQLCNVLGVRQTLDPDKTYELTTDNIMKMLAIHMRFRCNIPVVVMGETGCGKTRLIKFLCELRRAGVNTQNLTLVKVHGGTTSEMIYNKVREAEAKAATNKQDHNLDSVLFFDEANTTEAVSSIKEVLCDGAVEGKRLAVGTGLQIIAACNPYRKHSDEMIQRLESAGLGYRVRAEETEEKLGSIPLRQLVYRVQVLPPSMIPLVWDFGQLNDQTEKIYIQQIVQRVLQVSSIDSKYSGMMANALSLSQGYMRSKKDECSFVSLRDVERCMQVFVWFHNNTTLIFSKLQQNLNQERKKQGNPTVSSIEKERRDSVIWALVMAMGVCYHACLENKEGYRKEICKSLPEGYTPQRVLCEIIQVQDLLLSGIPLGETIAKNTALKENVFMMVVCIELRIPLFLVGKPGSSKSLSKTLVADAMQGQAAYSDLFRKLKQVHLVSFQCSPHSTPEGIINTFKQCARFQESKNLDEYVSVVVLDEIGLAEDSSKMPLKTLHPLLEEGCIDDEPHPHKKVGFVGISNWALDPAKMNRGIFVSRGDPDKKELIRSARGICSSDKMVLQKVQDLFHPFAQAYLRVSKGKGFFGLRDYYSLIKMVFGYSKASKQRPSTEQILEAVLRNFSGRDDMDVVSIFTDSMRISPYLESDISTIELVRKNIFSTGSDNECRYLLVLTKNYAALQILQQMFYSDQHQPEIIFGSSFPKDQEYTQICRNINRVKICMETGQTVILLNLQNLYESLYDALNQYYVCLGGQNYVDLGLGTHRVKCRVHPKFRLIVIEEKEVVYREFPVPLINRLEKHYLDMNAVLKSGQKETVKELEGWVEQFITPKNQYSMAAQRQKYQPPDVFIGYHSDTCSSVVLQVTEKLKQEKETPEFRRRVLEEAKLIVLNCATPDSVVRLQDTDLPSTEAESLTQLYFQKQQHSSLAEFILSHTHLEGWGHSHITEVTTFSRLLTVSEVDQLRNSAKIPSTELLSLQQFDTEQSFLKKIRSFLDSTPDDKMLIIQTDFDEGTQSACILASAKYSAINEINKIGEEDMTGKVYVYFITKLPRVEGGTSYVGFHGGNWSSVHIDDLRRSEDIVSDIKALRGISISQLFQDQMDPTEVMEVVGGIPEQAEGGLPEVLDTMALLRSCVQSAVSVLRDQVEGGARCTRRVEILLTLLADNKETSAVFLKTVKRRLHCLLAAQESDFISPKNWVVKEASNANALQEGGTFKHTLWKRVQVAVIPLLAHLVSVLDRDCNLDLLLDCNSGESVKKLWLDMFGDVSLLDIRYTRTNHSTESQTVLVQSHIRAGQGAGQGAGCAMPFSWRVRELLEEVWAQVQQRNDCSQQKFEEIFGKTSLGQLISHSDTETQSELLQRYLQDFVSMTIKVTSEDELRLLCRALTSSINELSAHHPLATPLSLPWVHIAYQQFCSRLHNLHRMLTLLPHLAPPLLRTTPTGETGEMVVDVLAALACVEQLEPQQLQWDSQRLAWLRQVKSLQVPLQLVCAQQIPEHWGQRSQALIGQVRNGWNRIFVLSLFVEHLLMGAESEEDKLKDLILDHTLRLGKVLEKSSDLKLEASFVAVIEVLKSCKDAASRCISEHGLAPCPMCSGDPLEPLVLPCGHVFCLGCGKQWLVLGQMYCPKCVSPVPDDFPLLVSKDVSVLIRFRKRCQSFFIELVSSVCFQGNDPPSQGVICHLLSFIMVEAEPFPLIQVHQRQILTKALSPFHESVDRTPVVRSVLLKLLLKYSFSDVREYLQQHLSAVEQSIIMEEEDKCNLYALYINCLQDPMFEKLQCHMAIERKAFLQVERDFLCYFLSHDTTSVPTVTVEQLQQVARVRLCLETAAQLLIQGLLAPTAEPPPGVPGFLDSVRDLCSHGGNDWYRVYLIRLMSQQQGAEFVQNLLKEGALPWLFPQEILMQRNDDGGQMDLYLLCGEGYGTIREAVAKATGGYGIDQMDAACEDCGGSTAERTLHLLLALFREVTTLYRPANPVLHPKPELCQVLEDYIQNSRVLVSREVRTFATALVQNRLGPLSVQPDRTGVDHTLTELAVHLSAVLLCGAESGVLTPLRQLAMSPSNMQQSFLPTMPEDVVNIAVKAMGPNLKWYSCPSGHLCAIGECGKPTEESKCVDCGAVIGGVSHTAVKGFTATDTHTTDRTQPGHILGDPSRRGNPEALDTRNVSPLPFTDLRLLTHLSMLLGATTDPQAIGQIIKPPVQDPVAFLMGHLHKDLEELTQILGLGFDDIVTSAHLLLSSLMEPHLPRPGHAPSDGFLSTKEARRDWETTVISNIIAPQLKDLEHQLKEANALIRRDSRVTSNPVLKVVFGDPHLFLSSLPRHSLVHRGAVWSCRERVSLPNLAHELEQNGGKEAFPLLWTFLQKEAELRLVKFLPDIVALQRELVKWFQNQTNPSYGTIGEFLQNQRKTAQVTWEKHIRTFLSVWNKLRLSLATNGEIQIPVEFCQEDLDLSSDLQLLLPRRQGVGLCSTALVSYLIALHNQLVYASDKHTGEETSYRVTVSDLTELHMISYEPERDLIPVVLSNCQYSLECGRDTVSEYDLPKIQQLVLSRVLQGKPIITLSGIPALFSRRDRDYEQVFMEVKAKVGQEPLPALKAGSLLGQLQAYSDVCETLGVVELALDFLAAAGGDAHMELVPYLKNVLRMDQVAPYILKALSSCSLKHCVALWQILSSRKSESVLRLKRDPFERLGDQYRKPLDGKGRRLLLGFCSRGSEEAFLSEMHQLLLLHLSTNRDPELYRPDWGLKETLQSYMEHKDLDLPPAVEELFPEELRLSQALAAWKFTVCFKWGWSLG